VSQPIPPNAEERQFLADLQDGLAAMKEAAATRTTCVLPSAQVRAVLTVLEAATGALATQPVPDPGDGR